MPFTPIPAIDIRDGRCVRLVQGDYARETVYGDDPAAMAQRWAAEGATRLHVVDLDGARDGERQNANAIDRLLRAVNIPVQVGGGIRRLADAEHLLASGADRIVIGTAAAEQPAELRHWVAALGAERIVVGVDVRNDLVVTRGWIATSTLTAAGFCRQLVEAGVVRILFTDVSRDGMLTGPNVEAVRTIVTDSGLRVIASGGVGSIDHLHELADAGAEAAIVGTALYDGRVQLADALAVTRDAQVGAA